MNKIMRTWVAAMLFLPSAAVLADKDGGQVLFANKSYGTMTKVASLPNGCTPVETVKGEAPSLLPSGRNFELVWHDEFNGTALDESKWCYRTNFWGVRFRAFAGPEDGCVEVKDGKLHLKLKKRADGDFCSPQLQTGELLWDYPWDANRKSFWPLGKREKPKFVHRYGYYEARCRLQRRPGWWSAFWMQTETQGACLDPARAGIEHDIMESFAPGCVGRHMFHMNGYGADYRGYSIPPNDEHTIDLSTDEFHTFGLLWEPDGYTVFYDGRQDGAKRGHATGDDVSATPEFILLSTECQWYRQNRMTGKAVAELEESARLGDDFVVDFVRVYDQKSVAATGVAFRLGEISQIVFEDSYATNSAKSWGAAAVRDLHHALVKVIGREICWERESRARKPGGVTVYVGDTAAARAAGLDAKTLRRGAFRIVTRPGQAFILANTGMAATYGVAEFLQRHADYWFCVISGDDPYTVQPERIVPCEDLTREHEMYARHYSLWGRNYAKTCQTTGAEFSRRTRSRSWNELEPEEMPSRLPGYSHSYYKYVPPELYWKTHPEYYSLAEDGLRHSKANCASELCLSNPDVLEIVFTNMCGMIAKERAEKGADAPKIYDFSQMDNASYICLCPDCKKIIAKYNKVPGGHAEGGDAGLQLEFVNKLARKVKAVYPDVIVRTFAYVTTDEPPKGDLRPDDNVMIWLCDLYSQCDDMLPLEHPFNANRLRLVREWAAKTKHFEIWDYYLGCGDYPTVDAAAADIRLFRRIGLKRMYNETGYANQPFYELMRFVTSELYFDSDRDLERLVATWCRVYGKGAAKMKAAIDYLRRIVLENPPRNMAGWHTHAWPFETAENLEKALAMMKEAYDLEAPGTCRARMAQPMGHICGKLLRIYKTLDRDGDAARAKELYRSYSLEALGASGMHEADVKAERRRIAATVELAGLVFTDLPDELRDVPKKDLKFIDYHHFQPGYKTATLVTNGVPGGRGYRWTPLTEKDYKPPFNCSMLDEDLVYNHLHPFTPIPDNQWHWYKIAVDRLGRGGWVGMPYIGDNSLAFKIQHLYVECDGLPADPNWYEMWVSVKWGGDVRDPEKGLVADRLILRRVPEPKAKKFNDLNAQ